MGSGHERKIAALRAAVDEGDASGVSTTNVFGFWLRFGATAGECR